MAGPAPSGPAPQRGPVARILAVPQRAILGSVMSLAVIVLERRIRKALRAEPGGSGPPSPGGAGGEARDGR